jgi:hypothetical protein
LTKKTLAWLIEWSLVIGVNGASFLFLQKGLFPGVAKSRDNFLNADFETVFAVLYFGVLFLVVYALFCMVLLRNIEKIFKRPPISVVEKVFDFIYSRCVFEDIIEDYWWGKFLVVWFFLFTSFVLTIDIFLRVAFFATAIVVEILVTMGNLSLAFVAQKRRAVIVGAMVGYGVAFLLDDIVSGYSYATVIGMVAGAVVGRGLSFFQAKLERNGYRQFVGIMNLSLQ